MRKLMLILAVIFSLALVLTYYPGHVEKPKLDGSGPMAIRLDASLPAPEYHSPPDWWQTHHMDAINRGDFQQADCLYCHAPQTSCNNCHAYVGVDAIATNDE
jgi:hypothetical protein